MEGLGELRKVFNSNTTFTDKPIKLTLFKVENGREASREIIHITGVTYASSTSVEAFTILRGQEGTTAQEWIIGTKGEARLTAEHLNDFVDRDSLEVGGDNLLFGTLDTTSSYWATLAVLKGQDYFTFQNTSGFVKQVLYSIKDEENYTFSFNVSMISQSNPITFTIGFEGYDLTLNSLVSFSTQTIKVEPSIESKRYSVLLKLKTPQGINLNQTTLTFFIKVSGDVNGGVSISRLKLERGTVATDWSINYLELLNRISDATTRTILNGVQNLNRLTTEGRYVLTTSNNINAPNTSPLFLDVDVANNSVCQTAWRINTSNSFFRRVRVSSNTWGDWEVIITNSILQEELNKKANAISPSLIGVPRSTNPPEDSNDNRIATTSFVNRKINILTEDTATKAELQTLSNKVSGLDTSGYNFMTGPGFFNGDDLNIFYGVNEEFKYETAFQRPVDVSELFEFTSLSSFPNITWAHYFPQITQTDTLSLGLNGVSPNIKEIINLPVDVPQMVFSMFLRGDQTKYLKISKLALCLINLIQPPETSIIIEDQIEFPIISSSTTFVEYYNYTRFEVVIDAKELINRLKEKGGPYLYEINHAAAIRYPCTMINFEQLPQEDPSSYFPPDYLHLFGAFQLEIGNKASRYSLNTLDLIMQKAHVNHIHSLHELSFSSISQGDRGTFTLAVNQSSSAISPNQTVPGSSLKSTNLLGNNQTSTLKGTWKNMGAAVNGNTSAELGHRIGLFLRIA